MRAQGVVPHCFSDDAQDARGVWDGTSGLGLSHACRANDCTVVPHARPPRRACTRCQMRCSWQPNGNESQRLLLASIAVMFAVAIFAKQMLGTPPRSDDGDPSRPVGVDSKVPVW